MSLGHEEVTQIIVAALLLAGTWITARVTKANSKLQADAQLKQVDQSAFNVAEGIYKNAIEQLLDENKGLKAENVGLKLDVKELQVRQREQEKEINLLKGLIRNVE